MTLVVAQILDNGTIAMFSDTKLLYEYVDDNNYNRFRSLQVYQQALPKIVILRHDLAVGIAGDGVTAAVGALTRLRHLAVEDLLVELQQVDGLDFIIAALYPVRLWAIKQGQRYDRLTARQAWVGDVYTQFHDLETSTYPEHFDLEQRLLASMQTLVHRIQPLSVGGYVVHLETKPDDFRFAPVLANIAPSHLHGFLSQASDGTLSGQIVVPPGVDPTVTELHQLVGKPPTRGSIALYVPPARMAWLFTEREPWKAVPLQGASVQEIIQAAAALGQRISMCGCIDDDHVSTSSVFQAQTVTGFARITRLDPLPVPPAPEQPYRELWVELCDQDGNVTVTLAVAPSQPAMGSEVPAGSDWVGADLSGVVRLTVTGAPEAVGTVQLNADLTKTAEALPADVLPALEFLALVEAGRCVRLRLRYGPLLAESQIAESVPGRPWLDRLIRGCKALCAIQQRFDPIRLPDLTQADDDAINGWLRAAALLGGSTLHGHWADADICVPGSDVFTNVPIDVEASEDLWIDIGGESIVVGTVTTTYREAILSPNAPPVPHDDHIDVTVVPARMPGIYLERIIGPEN